MIDVRHLIQDLRAEAPNASPEHRELMRSAADELDRFNGLTVVRMFDTDTRPPPIPPPGTKRGRHHQVKGAPCD